MRWFLLLSFTALWLAACAAPRRLQPSPPVTQAVSTTTNLSTPVPASTDLPPSPTADVLSTMLPSGVPARDWQGIPIMPGAIKGDGDDLGYVFSTQASEDEIRSFYQEKLPLLGWQYQAYGAGDAGPNAMIFTAAEGTLIISIYPYPGEGNLVVIAR